MIDRLFTAALTFCLLIGATFAIGSAWTDSRSTRLVTAAAVGGGGGQAPAATHRHGGERRCRAAASMKNVTRLPMPARLLHTPAARWLTSGGTGAGSCG